MPARRLPPRRLGLGGEHDRQIELEDRHPFTDPAGVEHAWSDLADGADLLPPRDERRRARRMKAGGNPSLVDPRPDSERRGNLSPDGDRRRCLGSGEDDTEHLPLVGELAGTRPVDVPDLEQGDAVAAMRRVEGDGAQQSGPQRRPQNVLLGDQRVGDPQHLDVEAGTAQVVVGQEWRWHHLGDPEPEQHLANLAASLLDRAEVAVQWGQRDALRDVVVAVVAGDLLDDVDLGSRVRTPARQADGQRLRIVAGDREADRIEQPDQVACVTGRHR